MRNLGNISDLYEQVKLNEGKIKERKLTDAEKDKLKKLEKEVPMKDFKDRYGKEGEAVYYATLTKMAKKEGFASDAQRRAAFAQGYKAKGKKGKKEEVDIQEDGHVDVASAVRQCKTITEDAMQMLQKLQTMSPEDALPTWWTNKLAVASNNMNKMRDYLLVPSVSEEVELNEAVVSVYGFISTGERKKFLDNLKSMRLQFKSKVMNLPVPAPPSGVLKFDANQSTIEAIIKFAKRMKLKIIKENIDEELDKDDEDTVKTIIGKLKKASKAHAGQAKQLSKDLQDEKELDEMKYTHVAVDKKGLVIGFASDEKDAKDMARRNDGKVVKLKKPMSDKKGDMMVNRPFKEEVELSETIVDFDYSRNPKGIYNAWLQMSKKLGLTLFNAPTGVTDLKNKGTGRIGATKSNMVKFMKYLNSKGIEPSVDIVNEARDDDEDDKAAMKNIIMQMRKVVSLRGNFKVEFKDGSKEKLEPRIAQAVQDKFNRMRRADDKEAFMDKISKSKRDLLNALKESINEQKLDEIPALAVPLAIGAIRAAPTVAKFVSRGGGAPVGAAAQGAYNIAKKVGKTIKKKFTKSEEA